MNRTLLIAALLLPLGLMACDRPTIVNVPPAAEPVPGPPGPTGATGNQGNQGNDGRTGDTGSQGTEGTPGATGRTGDGTTVIVVPPAASAPNN